MMLTIVMPTRCITRNQAQNHAQSKSHSDTEIDELSESVTVEISDGVKKYLNELLHSFTTELKAEIEELKSIVNKK